MRKKSKAKRVPLWCQCKDCLETFSIEGVMVDGKLIELEEHPRVGHNGNGDYYHRCGGNGYGVGRLMIYLALESRRN